MNDEMMIKPATSISARKYGIVLRNGRFSWYVLIQMCMKRIIEYWMTTYLGLRNRAPTRMLKVPHYKTLGRSCGT
jgi:hypothetical protein